MARSLKKGPFIDEHLAKKVAAQNDKEIQALKEEQMQAAQIENSSEE